MEKTKKQKIEELIEKLYLSITENPEEWKSDEYSLEHIETSVDLWMCGGRVFFRVYKPYKTKLPFFASWKLYNVASKLWKKHNIDYKEQRLDENYKTIKKLK